MAEYTIAYDFGTGSVKAALVGRDYAIRDCAVSAYPTYYPHPGWVEQHPEDYWDSFIEVTRKLLSLPGVDASMIRGIVFSQTSAAIIFIDQEGNSLYDCVTWVDGRAVEEAPLLNALIDAHMPPGTYGVQEKNVSPKLMWFLRNRPDVVEKAHCVLDPAGYLFFKTTGELAYEHTGATATRLYDKLSRKWDERWFPLTGIPRRLIPDRVVASTDIVGGVTVEAARQTGLRPGTPVVAGCSDNANGQLGSGCIRKGDAHLYMGSSGWLSVTGEQPDALMPSAVPGMGFYYYCTNSVGTSIDWVVQKFYAEEFERIGKGVYDLMGAELAARGDSGENVLFTPWLYGEEAPVLDVNVRGSILNLQPTTTRADVARAVAEGIGFNFRWMKENHENEVGPITGDIVLIGGVSLTKQVVQTIADVMNTPLTTLKSHRFAGNVGLAACVDIALGDMQDFSALPSLLPKDTVFTPNPQKQARYDKLYRIYRGVYTALGETYTALASLRQ